MNKKIIIILLLSIVSFNKQILWSQNKKIIKSKRITHFYNEKWSQQEYIVFNKKGNETERVLFLKKDTIHSIKKSKYNSKNKIVKVKEIFPANKTKSKLIEYKYIGDNLIDERNYSDGKLNSKKTYAYTKDNKLLNESKFNEDNRKVTEFTYQYDTKGNQIEKCMFRYGKISQKYIFQYNNKNQLVKRELFINKNKLDEEHTYSYHPNDKIEIIRGIRYSHFSSHKKFTSTTSLYNNKELLIESSTFDSNHMFVRKTIKEYDEFDNCTLWKEYYSNGDLRIDQTYIITYNDHNEVIKTIQLNKDKKIGKSIVYEIKHY